MTLSGSVWLRSDPSTPLLHSCRLVPERYTWAAVGGPESATLRVEGPIDELAEALSWARCPVRIHDSEHGFVWWGYIHEIELDVGGVAVGTQLDNMANRVRVAYELPSLSGDVGTAEMTDWATDDESITLYGTREYIGRMSWCSTDAAEDFRDRLLASRARPPRFIRTGHSKEPMVRLHCRGWFPTLGWMHYQQDPVNEGNYNSSNIDWKRFAFSTTDLMLAQSFQLGVDQPFLLSRLGMLIERQGEGGRPGLTVEIRSDNSGKPNRGVAALATGAIAWDKPPRWDDTTKATKWTDVVWSPAHVSLSYGTTYWLCVYRSDEGFNDSDFYQWAHTVNNDYTRGKLRVLTDWEEDIWADVANADAVFVIDADWDTSSLAADIVTECGQFLTLGAIPPTGVYQHVDLREGRNDGLNEMRNVVKIGTANNRRYLPTVDMARTIHFAEEPASAYASDWWLDWQGNLYDSRGNRVDPQRCPVGKWVRMRDLDYPGVGGLQLRMETDLAPAFIERATYDCASGRLSLEFLDQPDPLVVAGGLD